MPTNEFDQDSLQSLTQVDRLVHEPARLMILAILNAVESADFLFLLRQTGLTRGNLSSHMSKLEEAGYLLIKKEFVDKIPRTLLQLTDKGQSALQDYRAYMLQVLNGVPVDPGDNKKENPHTKE